MLKGLGNIASLINSAKTMGPKMQAMQESGGGMVSVHASGDGKIVSVEFDSVLSESNDMEMARDLLPAAINAALEKASELKIEMMKGVTDDLPLPDNMEEMMKNILGGGN